MNHNPATDAPHLPVRHGDVRRWWVTPGTRDWLDVTYRQFYINRLAPAFDGFRIAHFSDLHFDGVMITRARLEQLVATINAEQPDLIAFTGDFVTHRTPFREDDLIAPLRELQAREGKFAVTGNHDRTNRSELIDQVVDASGMTNLNNDVYTIRRGDDVLHIAGVDSLSRHRARLDLVLQKLPETGAAVLLAHEPDFADVSASARRFALQLSGHTHGGQIRIPWLTRLLLGGYNRRPLSGAMLVGRMILYVNRGIGTVGTSLRFNCPPELSLITLQTWDAAKWHDDRTGNTTESATS